MSQVFTYKPCPDCGSKGICVTADRKTQTAIFECKGCGQRYSTVTDSEGNLASVSAGGPTTHQKGTTP